MEFLALELRLCDYFCIAESVDRFSSGFWLFKIAIIDFIFKDDRFLRVLSIRARWCNVLCVAIDFLLAILDLV